jgi:hypothetical protein
MTDMAIVNCYIVHKEMASRIGVTAWTHRVFMEKLHEAMLAVKDEDFKESYQIFDEISHPRSKDNTVDDAVNTAAKQSDDEQSDDEQSDDEEHTAVECSERKKNNRLKRYRCKVCYAWRKKSKQGDFDTKYYCKECTEKFDGTCFVCNNTVNKYA